MSNLKITELKPEKTRFEKAFCTSENIISSEIPKRQWVLGDILLKKHLTAIGAVPGCGKTTLAFGFAFSIATGIDLFNEKVHESGAVWYHNAEDPAEEMMMKFEAYCKYYKVDMKTVPLIITGAETNINFNKHNNNNENLIKELEQTIISNNIIALFLDPFINIHSCLERDETEMKFVTESLKRIARKSNCSVTFVQHFKKSNGSNNTDDKKIDMDNFRGTSGIMGAVRIAKGIWEEKINDKQCLCMADSKNNLSVKNDKKYYKLESQEITNGENIGVAVLYDPSKEITEQDIFILDLIKISPDEKIKVKSLFEHIKEKFNVKSENTLREFVFKAVNKSKTYKIKKEKGEKAPYYIIKNSYE